MDLLPKNSTRAARAATRRERVRELILERGEKVRDVALLLGTSTQRVYQILDELRECEEATA